MENENNNMEENIDVVDPYRKMMTYKEFVRQVRERCIDLDKHIRVYEMMYLGFDEKYSPYRKEQDRIKEEFRDVIVKRGYTREEQAEKEFLDSLTPKESEELGFLEANMKRCWEVLGVYKNNMANHRSLIISAEILGDKAFYCLNEHGVFYVVFANRKELQEHYNYMKEVDKCYQ